jgi:EmrB/QacA subfamily drug resistance transporter
MEAMPSAVPADLSETRYKWRILWSIVIGLFMVILDTTVINVALKAIQVHFAVNTDQAQWVISLYALVLGIGTPLSGYLGDRFGTKRIYLTGLAMFAVGSLLAGLASSQTSLVFLILARGLQGLGGGIALPLGMALMFRAFPPGQRGVAFGIFGIVMVFAPAIGPLLGGWLVDHNLVSWIFLVNLPVGLLGLVIGSLFLREEPGSKAVRSDIPGMVLAAGGFGAILYAASIAGEQGKGWTSPEVLLFFGIGLLVLVVFTIVELRSRAPLMDLRLYTIPSFTLANIASMVGTISLFGAEFLLPLYLQILRGETAFDAGLLLLPMAATSMVTMPIAGRLSDKIGPRIPMVIGFLLIAFNTYQLAHIELDTSLAFIMLIVAIRGIAVGLIIQNSQLASLLDVPLRRVNRATPMVNATRQTMQSIGVAVLATVLTSAITISVPAAIANGGTPNLANLPPAIRAVAEQSLHTFQSQYITGLDHAYMTTFVIASLVTILCLFLPGWPGNWDPKARQRAANARMVAQAAPTTNRSRALLGLILAMLARKAQGPQPDPQVLATLSAAVDGRYPHDWSEEQRGKAVAQDVIEPLSILLLASSVNGDGGKTNGGAPVAGATVQGTGEAPLS